MSIIDDAVLLKMAETEILGEARRAAIRHSIAGVSGWKPCFRPNKAFLTNTLLQTMTSNRILARKKEDKAIMHRKTKRKLLRTSAADKSANFQYKKPKQDKDQSMLIRNSDSSNKKRSTSDNKQLTDKKVKKRSSVEKVIFKKG